MIEGTDAERRLEITEIEADSQKLEWFRTELAAANAKIESLLAELGDQQAYEDLRAERDVLRAQLADISDAHREGFGAGVEWAGRGTVERDAARSAGFRAAIEALRDEAKKIMGEIEESERHSRPVTRAWVMAWLTSYVLPVVAAWLRSEAADLRRQEHEISKIGVTTLISGERRNDAQARVAAQADILESCADKITAGGES